MTNTVENVFNRYFAHMDSVLIVFHENHVQTLDMWLWNGHSEKHINEFQTRSFLII